jgi:hypothetical protein
MKKVLLLFAILGMYFVSFAGTDSGGPDKFIGKWNISVPDSPLPEYSSSILVFSKEGKTIKGSMGINEYMMDVEDLVIKGNKAEFVVYVQGEKINISLKRKGNTLNGTAVYSQGSLTVTGTKQP